MSFGILTKLKKKSLDLEIDPCPAGALVRSLSSSARQKSPPLNPRGGICDWEKKKDDYNTITKAYHFDSGLSGCAEGSTSPVLAHIPEIPPPTVRKASSEASSQHEMKRNKSLMSSIQPHKGKLLPLFKRKSSSNNSSHGSEKDLKSLNSAESLGRSLSTGATKISYLPDPLKYDDTPQSSNSSTYSGSSAFTEHDPLYTIVVADEFDL